MPLQNKCSLLNSRFNHCLICCINMFPGILLFFYLDSVVWLLYSVGMPEGVRIYINHRTILPCDIPLKKKNAEHLQHVNFSSELFLFELQVLQTHLTDCSVEQSYFQTCFLYFTGLKFSSFSTPAGATTTHIVVHYFLSNVDWQDLVLLSSSTLAYPSFTDENGDFSRFILGTQWHCVPTLLLKHKLISHLNLHGINRRPSTCSPL